VGLAPNFVFLYDAPDHAGAERRFCMPRRRRNGGDGAQAALDLAAPGPAEAPVYTPRAEVDPPPRGAMRTLAEITLRLRAVLRRKGRSREDAEDLVQDALLKYALHGGRSAVRDPEAFIARTAFNQAIDQARRGRRAPFSSSPLEAFDLIDPTPSAEDQAAARAGVLRLEEGLAALGAQTRDIVLAQRLDGLSYAQIARRHGLSISAVEKRLARGMLFLQDWMEGW
jgi:RNA polymerase sigma-70 factor (ECF subfamily)